MIKETLEQALEAFIVVRFSVPPAQRPTIERAITEVIEALAKQDQRSDSEHLGEPVRGVYWKCVLCGFAHIEDECPECGHHTRAEFAFPQPKQEQGEPLTDKMILVAARVMNDRQADACNVDKDDQWKIYGQDFIDDARAALEAAHGIKENT